METKTQEGGITESLEQTLQKQRKEKYDARLEKQIREWLFSELKLAPNPIELNNIPLQELLKDGTYLCK